MGDLIELIFSNFLILAAIIGGVISWFSSMSKENEPKQRPGKEGNPVPAPPSYPSGPAQDSEPEPQSKTGEDRLKEYYTEKQKRLKEISRSGGLGEPIGEHSQQMEDNSQTGPNKQKNSNSTAKQLSEKGPLIESARKWDKKRLAEGILMSEVLGPPRAHKPHQSHPRKR